MCAAWNSPLFELSMGFISVLQIRETLVNSVKIWKERVNLLIGALSTAFSRCALNDRENFGILPISVKETVGHAADVDHIH